MKNTIFSRNLRRGLAVAAIVGAGLAVTGTGANAATGNTWDALAQCESSGNWGANTGNGFSGGLQFTQSTWAAYGGSGSAAGASRAEQIAVAERVQAGQGWGAWPACSAQLGLSGGGGATYTPAQTPAPTSYVAPTTQSTYVAPTTQSNYVAPVEQAPVQAVAAAPVNLSGKTYTVAAGDTLSGVAQKLGLTGGWETLYSANAGTVSNPNLIFTGQVLQLPAQ